MTLDDWFEKHESKKNGIPLGQSFINFMGIHGFTELSHASDEQAKTMIRKWCENHDYVDCLPYNN